MHGGAVGQIQQGIRRLREKCGREVGNPQTEATVQEQEGRFSYFIKKYLSSKSKNLQVWQDYEHLPLEKQDALALFEIGGNPDLNKFKEVPTSQYVPFRGYAEVLSGLENVNIGLDDLNKSNTKESPGIGLDDLNRSNIKESPGSNVLNIKKDSGSNGTSNAKRSPADLDISSARRNPVDPDTGKAGEDCGNLDNLGNLNISMDVVIDDDSSSCSCCCQISEESSE